MIGYIYKLSIAECVDKLYIGSSFDIDRRITSHESSCTRHAKCEKVSQMKLYEFINKYSSWDKVKVEIIDKLENVDKVGLSIRETYWINFYGDKCLNERLPINDIKIPEGGDYPVSIIGKRISEVFPIELDAKPGTKADCVRTESTRSCECGEQYGTLDFDGHTKYNEKHLAYLQSLKLDCGCGVSYDYKSQHNHVKLVSHKKWESEDKRRYNDFMIICRCGSIVKYEVRGAHNATH